LIKLSIQQQDPPYYLSSIAIQIALREEDQSKTSFITLFGAYCYKTMSFGLKNVGATYQRAIQTCLGEQIGDNTKAYVNDIVVKTKTQTC
jgi:hypothetical protein